VGLPYVVLEFLNLLFTASLFDSDTTPNCKKFRFIIEFYCVSLSFFVLWVIYITVLAIQTFKTLRSDSNIVNFDDYQYLRNNILNFSKIFGFFSTVVAGYSMVTLILRRIECVNTIFFNLTIANALLPVLTILGYFFIDNIFIMFL